MNKSLKLGDGLEKDIYKKNKTLADRLEILLLPRNYLGITAGLFVISLLIGYNCMSLFHFYVYGVPVSFMIASACLIAYISVLYIRRELDMRMAFVILFAVGIALRISYGIFTDPGKRTHDVYREWGHLDYMGYIADHVRLPPVNLCQTYHPPVHHILSAVVIWIGRALSINGFVQLKLVQALMVVLNVLTVVYFYRILKLTKLSDRAILLSVMLFAFHPANIFLAPKINNDNTMFFFYMVAFYYLMRWRETKSTRDIVKLALSLSLSILTKKSAIMLVPVIGTVFVIDFFYEIKKPWGLIRQYLIFAAVSIPLSLSHTIRNYILFRQSFGYVPSLGTGFTPSLYNLFYIPVKNIFTHPFTEGGLDGGQYFIEFLLKSSLFGEWQFPQLEVLAEILLVLTVLNVALVIIGIFIFNKKETLDFGLLFLVNLIVPLVLAAKFRTEFPIACSEDFRYVLPVLISGGYFSGKVVDRVFAGGSRLLKSATVTVIAGFSISCIIFTLFLGGY